MAGGLQMKNSVKLFQPFDWQQLCQLWPTEQYNITVRAAGPPSLYSTTLILKNYRNFAGNFDDQSRKHNNKRMLSLIHWSVFKCIISQWKKSLELI